MGIREEQVVNGRRVKTEVIGIVLFDFAATLVEPAIDKDALAATFKQVTGTGYTLGRTMKRNLHVFSSPETSAFR